MGKRGCDPVGCIRWLRRRLQAKNSRDHELNLFLRRCARPDHSLLYLGGRILCDLESCVRGGEKNHTPRVTEHDGSPNISRKEDVFDGKGVGAMALYQLADSLVDLLKPGGERISRFRANHPALDEPWGQGAIALDDAVTRDSGSGIDPEHYHSPGLSSSRVALALCGLVYVAVRGDFLHVIEVFELLEELHE